MTCEERDKHDEAQMHGLEKASAFQHPQEKGRSNTFRVRCKFLFVTYSQIPPTFSFDELTTLYATLGARIAAGVETHPETGGKHVHVFAEATKKGKFDFRNSRALDVSETHPNIIAINRTPELARDYALKDGNIIIDQFFDAPPVMRAKKGERAKKYHDILAATSYNDFHRRIKDEDPGAYVRSFTNVLKCSEYLFPQINTRTYASPQGFISNSYAYPEIAEWESANFANIDFAAALTEATPSLIGGEGGTVVSETSTDPSIATSDEIESTISGWLEENPMRYDSDTRSTKLTNTCKGRAKALIIWGATRTGKTIWARSLGKHCYWNNIFDTDQFDESNDYAVFDDIKGGLGSIDYKQWIGAQNQFAITSKYKRHRTIYWNKPCIYISNDDPLESKHVDIDWLLGNAVIVKVETDKPLAEVVTPVAQ